MFLVNKAKHGSVLKMLTAWSP